MCIIAAKYFDNVGWVGAKNRDRNYIPEISFKYQTSDSTEILIFWDEVTKYCEGLNSNGVCILSSSLMVKDDEKEITVRTKSPSKDGIKIKKALKCLTIKEAAKCLIEEKLPGNTLIFDKNTCYLIEGCWKPGGYKKEDYAYKIKKIPHNETVVRTNHGVWLPWAGYQRTADNKSQTMSRISSECRKDIAEYVVEHAKSPDDLIDGLAKTYIDNPQLNCLRTATSKKMMRTTSQIMLIPSEFTMYIRPIQSHIDFNFWKMNHPKHNLWIEILGDRVLYDHNKEIKNIPFPKMSHWSK